MSGVEIWLATGIVITLVSMGLIKLVWEFTPGFKENNKEMMGRALTSPARLVLNVLWLTVAWPLTVFIFLKPHLVGKEGKKK